jgi:hypothetical protein
MQAAVPSTVPLTQLASSRRGQLDRVIEAGLAAQGRVFALSLEPVRQSLGGRWEVKRDHVWDVAERTLERRLPPPDVFMRVDDTTFVAAVASQDAYDGQVLCADILRGLLSFFLGRNADDDVVLKRVASLDGGGLQCAQIDPFAPRPLKPPQDTPPVPSRGPEDWTPPLAGRRHTAIIQTASHAPVEVAFEIVPVWRLDTDSVGAFRIARDVADVAPLSSAQVEAVDRATIDFLLPLLDEYRQEGGVFALIAPLSFPTLALVRPRLALIHQWATVADLMRQAVILEMQDVDAGVPTGRTGETAAMMAPFFRGLMVGIEDIGAATKALSEHPFCGVVIDGDRLSVPTLLGRLIRAARKATRNILLVNGPPGLDEESLRRAGVTHVAAREASCTPAPDTDPVRPDALVPA